MMDALGKSKRTVQLLVPPTMSLLMGLLCTPVLLCTYQVQVAIALHKKTNDAVAKKDLDERDKSNRITILNERNREIERIKEAFFHTSILLYIAKCTVLHQYKV
jgi:hypothetical protein